MARNLISVGDLEKSGLIGKIKNGMLKMFKGAMVVCTGGKKKCDLCIKC